MLMTWAGIAAAFSCVGTARPRGDALSVRIREKKAENIAKSSVKRRTLSRIGSSQRKMNGGRAATGSASRHQGRDQKEAKSQHSAGARDGKKHIYIKGGQGR